jgi:hypothetical protein
METSNNNLRDRVLLAIKNGETKMKPKWHFLLKAALLLLGVASVSVLLLYILSFALFIAEDNGLLDLPSFGFHGLWLLFSALPWLLIFLVLLFLVVLQILVKRYSFSYHRPLFFSAIASLMFIIGGSIILLEFDFHPQFLEYARQRQMPFAPMYERFCDEKHEFIHLGQIRLLETQGFQMESSNGEVEKVIFTAKTIFPHGIQFATGSRVVVIGPERDDVIEAEGVRTIAMPKYIKIRRIQQKTEENENESERF